jgi:hypothetical protein
MLGMRTVTVTFEEADLMTPLPACVEVIAAALLMGYRLLPPPEVSHEDVTLGCERLLQFKDARRARLRREIRWHFLAIDRQILGESEATPVRAFVRRYTEDGALRRAIEADPRYARWRDKLRSLLLTRPRRSLLAIEGSRQCYGKAGGDAGTLRDFNHMMEEGFR